MDAHVDKNISAASTDPSFAITDQPSEFYTQHPPTRGDQQNPKKVELREKHAARQRRYRERQRNEKADINKQLTATAAEIENTLVERDNILAQQTVLSKAIQYCSSAVRAAQTLVSSTIGRARSQCRSAVDGMAIEGIAWLDLQIDTPSDAQLHAFIDNKSAEEMEGISVNATARSVNLFLRYDAEPEAREKIEAQLERIRSLRFRTVKHLFNTRPEIIIDISRRRIMPTGPDGAPNPKLVPAVAALNLTPEQVDSFEQEWILYRQNTESMRQEVRSLIGFLTSSGAEDNIAYFSLGAADLYISRLQAVQELELHPSKKTQAILTLSFWLPNNLNMAQKAILMKHSMPYYPDPIQFGRILFGEDSGIIMHSERVQSVYTDF